MKYRVRMSQGKWYVRCFDKHDVEKRRLGPFDTIDRAYKAAEETGYDDWDKEQ